MWTTHLSILLLSLVQFTNIEGGSLRTKRTIGQHPLHVPPLGVQTFIRSHVEQNPDWFRSAASDYSTADHFGTRSLPLRNAVENIPSKSPSRQPLRDAVEKRPPPDDAIDIEPFDLAQPLLIANTLYKQNGKPEKIVYQPPPSVVYSSPFVRFQKLVGVELVAPSYRISNPFQRIIGYTERGGRLAMEDDDEREEVEEVLKERYLKGKANLNEKYQGQEEEPRLVCYVQSAAIYRKEPLAFHSRDVDVQSCTHIIYTFATIDAHQFTIVANDYEYNVVKGGFRAITGLKRQNPSLKILISIGDKREEGGHKYTAMVSTASRRRVFIKSVIQFLDEFNFDGIELSWQYPGIQELGGRTSDKENLNLLLDELSEIFRSRNWILAMSVPASRFKVEDGYDVKTIADYVDFVNLQAYDFHTERDPTADHHSPLMRRNEDDGLNIFYNVDYAVRYWLKRALPKSKLNLGIAFYGRSFTLRFPNNTMPGSGIKGPGKEGFYTQIPGLLAYYEICDAILNEGWNTGSDDVGSPYAYNGGQWTGYENEASVEKKVLYAKELGLGGVSVWAVDLDDFEGICGEKYPLLNTVKRALYSTNTIQNSLPAKIRNTQNCHHGDGIYSDPNNCASYRVCRNGKSHLVHCQKGMMFDVENGYCDYIPAEKCNPGKSMFIPLTESQILHTKQLQQAGGRQKQKGPKMVCYITNWAFYRKSEGKFVPEHLDPRLCTHVIYAFASLEPESLMVNAFDPWADLDNNLYSRITSLQDVPVLLGLGGWTDSSGDKYSRLVGDGTARRRFVLGAVSFLRKHGFRGLHLDWNYPVCWQSNCQKGPSSDKPNFTKLVQELRQEFDKQSPPLILAAAISGYKEVIEVAYDLPALGNDLDFMSVMSYDYHGHWEKKTGHVSPLYHRTGDQYEQYNTNFTMALLVSKGAPKEKLLMGVPFYGQSFTIAGNSQSKSYGIAANGPGTAGEYTRQPGMLAYYEICHRIKNQNWRVNRDSQQSTGPYAYQNDQWVGYEDSESVREKARYIIANNYGGAVAWTVDLDDFSNRCCFEPFPLLRSLNRGLGLLRDSAPTRGDCKKPPEPVTPAAPTLTTGVDTGAISTTPMSSTTWPSWNPSATTSKKPSTTTTTTTRPTTQPTQTTTSPWWTTTTTTTKPSTTTMSWWQKPTGESTTTSPWWTSTTTTMVTTTTGRPTSTESWWSTTTKKPNTSTTKPSSTTTPWWQPAESTTIPSPAVVRPEVEHPPSAEGKPCEPGSYQSDPFNCNAYYRCILGELRKQYCAGGLHWNKRRNVCDWPMEAKCEGMPSTSSKPTPTSSRPTTTTSTTTRKPTTATPSECTTGQYYPHTNCNQFYVCVNGALVAQQCGSGLQWSIETNSCDWAFRINCAGRTGYTRQNIISRYVKKKPYSPCESGSYSGVSGDCEQYMMCLWGKYETFTCANGLHWNSNKQICDWPENAKCESGSGESTESSEMSTPSKPSTTTTSWQWSTVTTSTTTGRPSTTTLQPQPLSGYYKIVCYFTNWAWYRRGIGKFVPEDIDANLCTHIVYGFAVLDYENLVVKAHDGWADFDNKFYERVTAYKAKGLKVSLALGGWNDSQGDKYSRLVNNPAARSRFIKHVLDFLDKHNFDGLDLDWEYPKCWQVDCKKGPDSDKQAFAAFVRELADAFRPKGLLLSAAVSPSKTVIDAGYDVPVLAQYLDWIAVMCYDYHGQWDKQTGHVAPLYLHPEDDVTFFNANFSLNYWISEGVPRRKIIMGMPLYGQSFQLEKIADNGLNAKAPGPGQAGEFTRAAGFLAYYEICDRILTKNWTVVQDSEHRLGPYAYSGNQWVSYDDVAMIRRKSEYIRKMDLGGGMVWALDLDDFRNRCGQGVYPLMNTIRDVLKEPGTGQVEPPTTIKPKPEPPTVEPLPTTHPTRKPSRPSHIPTLQTTTQEIPSSTVTMKPLVDPNSGYKVVCYFTNWAWYRQGGGKYLPSDIDPDLCTHIVYGFAVLNGDQLIIKPHDSWADFDNKFYEKVTALRAKGIKVLIAIGGWNDSAGDKYSRLVNNPSARRRFIAHVVDFIRENNFDGLDLDWEYPKCWQVDCNKGPASDKAAFAEFVRELHEVFAPKNWLLSAAVSPAQKVIDAGYDVPVLSQYLDWIAVMCYDYHGQWDKQTGHVAPMYPHPEDVDVTFNANFSINYWISQGADRRKLVMGMSMYGQSFSLADNNVNGLNAPTYGGGEAGEATRARGFLSYYEICANIQKKGWKVVRDKKGRIGPYAYLRDQWVSFDDLAMIQHKSEYIRAMGLGGGMIWALDLDDFKNYCGCEEYPLLKTINRVLRGYAPPQKTCHLEPIHQKSPTTFNQSTTVKPLLPSTSTPLPCNGQIFQSDPDDCNAYYLCNQGQLMHQTCPVGLFWNRDHCDWPENTKCHPDAIRPDAGSGEVGGDKPGVEENVEMIVTTPGMQVEVKPGKDRKYKVVCYFTNWAWYRQGDGKYKPEDIDTNLCTHIIYGFAVLDSTTLTIKPHDSWADIDNEFYRKVTSAKAKGIKVLIAIGGWNDSLGDKYSRLVNDPRARKRFIEHVIQFIEKWGFDGLDLDWEYPKCWQVDCSKGPDSDKQSFTALVTELSARFRSRGWLLSAAVSPSKTVIDAGYDVAILAQHLDWIAVMTYDYHGHWDRRTGHVAPLHYYPGDMYDYFNANFSLNYWLEKGAPAHKLIMGIPLYGQSFTLADASNRTLNAPSYGPGEAGEFTRAGGFLAFYEVCERVRKRGWTVRRDPEGRIGPYAYAGRQWVGYDDVAEVRRKSRLVKQLGLGGGMIWALDLDDFRNRCGCGKHPLLRVLNQELHGGHFGAPMQDCT